MTPEFFSCLRGGISSLRQILISGHRTSRCFAVSAVAAALVACGGGDTDKDSLPSALTPLQAVQMLTATPKTYPAAMAVRVTTQTTDYRVMGYQRKGGPSLTGSEAFPVGSLTKSMTAALAGVLVQDGKVAWNTRLLTVFPELAASARPEYAQLELKDLLAHRGGLFPAATADQFARLPALSGSPIEQRASLVGWMLQTPSTSTPRAKTQYSNGDYVAAAAMLERLTGQPYEVLLQSRIFTPLNQTVSFGTPGAVQGEPLGHVWASGQWQAVSPNDPDVQFPAFANPAGGAKVSAQALARYLQMHLRAYRGINGEVLSPATARVIHTVVQDDFALGWQTGQDLTGRSVHWHNGSDDASYYVLMALSLTSDRASAVVVTGMGSTTEADVSETTVRVLR